MNRVLAILIVSIPLAFGAGDRRNQTLFYSTLALHLGDEEKSTVEQLRSRYKRVEKWEKSLPPGVESYLVQKEDDDIVGVITFKNGTLSKAYRDWTPSVPNPYGMAMAIQGAIESMKNENPCEIGVGSVREPNYSNDSSFITCGRKYIEIQAIQSSQLETKTSVSVYEWINDQRIQPTTR